MTTLTVGTGQEFTTISAAVGAAQDGDVIQVQAGTYVNDFAEIGHKITLEGVGGMVNLVAQGQIPNGKAILITDTDVTIDHFSFSGATVADGNGAGIRYQGGNLTLTNDSFTDDQNGLLSAPDPNGTITIKNSFFADDGTGDGHTHDLYVGAINALTIDNSLFTGAVVGHEVKSRAASTTITNSRIEDGPGGTASYDIDIPNGGNLSVANTVIEKAATAQNPNVISYGEEGVTNPGTAVSLSGDTVLDDLASPSSKLFVNDSGAAVSIQNLATFGLGSSQLLAGPGSVSGWTALASEPALNLASPITASTPSNSGSGTSSGSGSSSGAGTSGSDTLVLSLSEDAYQGDAQFTVSIDGTQVGGIHTATASHAAGQFQPFTITTTLAGGPHIIGVTFLNDAYAGTPSTDRNLYMNGATVNGTAVPNSALTLLSAGLQTFSLTAPSGTGTGSGTPSSPSSGTSSGAPPGTPSGTSSGSATSGSDTLVLLLSEDAYQGDAQFTVSIDGTQAGGIRTATASHGAGQSQPVTITNTLTPGPHTVGVTFLNDLYAGTPSTDRNLYVNGATVNGTAVPNSALTLLSAGLQTFSLTAPAASGTSSSTSAPPGTLVLYLSEDAYQGDAQFTVSVDGQQVGGTQTATASHAAGQTQAVTLPTPLAPGAHKITVNFLNDAYAGTPSTDRNLYVDHATLDGVTVPSSALTLLSAGPQSFTATETGTPSTTPTSTASSTSASAPITSKLVLNVAEQAYQGDAQMVVSVDGGPNQFYIITASQAAGQTQAVTLAGIAETFTPHDIAVSFIGQSSGGGTPATTRTLYVDGATFDGKAVGGTPLTFTTDGTQHLTALAPTGWTS